MFISSKWYWNSQSLLGDVELCGNCHKSSLDEKLMGWKKLWWWVWWLFWFWVWLLAVIVVLEVLGSDVVSWNMFVRKSSPSMGNWDFYEKVFSRAFELLLMAFLFSVTLLLNLLSVCNAHDLSFALFVSPMLLKLWCSCCQLLKNVKPECQARLPASHVTNTTKKEGSDESCFCIQPVRNYAHHDFVRRSGMCTITGPPTWASYWSHKSTRDREPVGFSDRLLYALNWTWPSGHLLRASLCFVRSTSGDPLYPIR